MSSSASPSARFWQRLPCLSLMCLILGKVTPSLQCCPAGTSVLLCNGTCQGARSSFWTCFHPSPIFPWVTPHEHRRLLAAAPTPSLVRDAAHGVGRDGKGRDELGRDGTGWEGMEWDGTRPVQPLSVPGLGCWGGVFSQRATSRGAGRLASSRSC